MKTSYIVLASCTLAILATVGLRLVDRGGRNVDVDDLRKEMNALSLSVAAREKEEPRAPNSWIERASRMAVDPPAAPRAALPEAGAETPPPPSEDAGRAPTPAEVRDNYEIAFAYDPGDPSWAREAVRRATDKMATAMPEGSQLRSIDCHSSLCRIETSHQDLSHYKDFVHATFMDPATQIWNAGTFSTPLNDTPGDPGGPLIIVSYVAREGHGLPDATQ